MSKQIVIAKILTSHGVKGCVKMESFMEKPKDIFNFSNDLYDSNNKKIKINFVGTVKPNVFITKIDGLDDMDLAKSYRNTELFLDTELLPKLKDDEVYFNDLIGLKVETIDKKHKGSIISVDDFGAGIIVEIKWKNEKMEESIPFTEDYFKEINIEKGIAIIERPEYM